MSRSIFLFFFRLLQGSVSKELLTLATISTAFSLLMVSLKSELMLVNITSLIVLHVTKTTMITVTKDKSKHTNSGFSLRFQLAG